MPRRAAQLLGKQVRVAESRQCLGGTRLHRVADLVGRGDLAHAATATACHRFDHHARRVRGEQLGDLRLVDPALGGVEDRHLCSDRCSSGRRLVAERLEGLCRRTNEPQTGGSTGARQTWLLTEESVSGMDKGGAGALRGVDDRVDVEVRLRSDALERDGLVGGTDVWCLGVVRGIHRDDAMPGLAGRSDDTESDLPTIGDEYGC